MDIAFDPSINNLGYCVWDHGTVVECDTLHPPKALRGDEERISWLLGELYSRWPLLDIVAVESFGPHYRQNVMSMHKLGMVIGMLICFSITVGARLVRVSKEYTPTKESVMLAKANGILTPKGKRASEHAYTAYHLGLITGFGKRR